MRNFYKSKLPPIPPGVKLLLTINILVFFIVEISGLNHAIYKQFGIVPVDVWTQFKLWQIATYQFLHGGFYHLFVNMFVLWMFGRDLELFWGKSKFLKYYFITAIGSGIVTFLLSINSSIPVIGASGAIYGILLAYGLLYPNRKVYVYFLFPIKIKYFVALITFIAFTSSFNQSSAGISHITHLSGILIGYVYLRRNNLKQTLNFSWFSKNIIQIKKRKSNQQDTVVDNTLYQRRLNEILEKLAKNGWDGLTESEMKILNSAGNKHDKPN
jgi:membrane associated rhomboid family serine protease